MIPEAFTPLGIALPIIVTGIVTIVSLALAVVCAWMESQDGWGTWLIGAILGGLIALTSGGFLASFMWGGPSYWQDYRIEGRVTNVTNAWDAAGGELSDRPVVTLDTVSMPLPVYDRRATTLEGQDVALTCTFGWRWRAADNVICYIADVGSGR